MSHSAGAQNATFPSVRLVLPPSKSRSRALEGTPVDSGVGKPSALNTASKPSVRGNTAGIRGVDVPNTPAHALPRPTASSELDAVTSFHEQGGAVGGTEEPGNGSRSAGLEVAHALRIAPPPNTMSHSGRPASALRHSPAPFLRVRTGSHMPLEGAGRGAAMSLGDKLPSSKTAASYEQARPSTASSPERQNSAGDGRLTPVKIPGPGNKKSPLAGFAPASSSTLMVPSNPTLSYANMTLGDISISPPAARRAKPVSAVPALKSEAWSREAETAVTISSNPFDDSPSALQEADFRHDNGPDRESPSPDISDPIPTADGQRPLATVSTASTVPTISMALALKGRGSKKGVVGRGKVWSAPSLGGDRSQERVRPNISGENVSPRMQNMPPPHPLPDMLPSSGQLTTRGAADPMQPAHSPEAGKPLKYAKTKTVNPEPEVGKSGKLGKMPWRRIITR